VNVLNSITNNQLILILNGTKRKLYFIDYFKIINHNVFINHKKNNMLNLSFKLPMNTG